VVNKADIGASALRTANELQAALGMGTGREDDWSPPVLLTSARDGEGIRELVDQMEGHRQHLEATDTLGERRLRGRVAYVLESLQRAYGVHGIESAGGREALEQRVRASGSATSVLLTTLGQEIEAQIAERPA
ncbi:MAG: methylmalonyl Co-A mutase-associated GTPase MeaB, partial [Myxococcota bacterium]